MEAIKNKIRNAESLLIVIINYAAIACIISSCAVSNSINNINGGFEYNDFASNEPDSWFANRLKDSNGYVEFKLDDKTAHNSEKSVSISISKSHPDRLSIYNWVRRISGLESNKTYELNGWIKTKEIKTSPFIELQFWNDKKKIKTSSISTLNQYHITGTQDWKYVKIIFKIPVYTSKVLILAGIVSTNNQGGKVWFDDIQIQKLE